jgi:metal-responsive CopG/Arc/MetJ family transcriptional regulator
MLRQNVYMPDVAWLALDHYCQCHQISSRSHAIEEIIMNTIKSTEFQRENVTNACTTANPASQ